VSCRRLAPPTLLTAIVGTVVILPWAVGGLPADRPDEARDRQTQLAAQPLAGLPAGETIREVSQATPFSLVALTGDDLTGTTAKVRARQADGSWGPWYEADAVESTGADSTGGPSRGTEPIFVGRTTSVQIAINRPAPVPMPTTRPQLGYLPANVEKPQTLNAVLITPPQAPADTQWSPPTAVITPGQPPNIITRAQWGADESLRCPAPIKYDNGIRAGIVHHTAGSNEYTPDDSAAIVRAIYAYHARTLGWCDIAYNALVDKYGQVFEGRAGGMDRPVEGAHTGGFNENTWGVAMIGDFDAVPPTPVQLHTLARLLGWRLAIDGVNPKATVTLTSAGGSFTHFPRGVPATLPTIFTHRDVGNTDCPGNAAYAVMDQIRDLAARFNEPPNADDLAQAIEGGAIAAKWKALGGMNGVLGAPTSVEKAGGGQARFVTFVNGTVYWSPQTGAQPINGVIRNAWGSLGYERGAMGLPTSGEIREPEWVVQNFQHGTLNFDPISGSVTKVIDGVAEQLPPAPPVITAPLAPERFSPIRP
jgi:uncharacterized protein with LGFP repeats